MRIAKKNNKLKKMSSLISVTTSSLLTFMFQWKQQEKRENVKDVFNEILAKHLKEAAIQVWELWRVSNKMNSKQNTLQHIIVKMAKD